MLERVKEMVPWGGWDVSRSAIELWRGNAIRSFFSKAFFFRRPRELSTSVNFDLTRALYRNEEPSSKYGAGFVKPMIDREIECVGLPTVSLDNADDEQFLNEAIADYWSDGFQQALRDAMRDGSAVVRWTQPRITNKLVTDSDRKFGQLEVIPPEMVELTYDPGDKNLLIQAMVTHYVLVDERTPEEVERREPPRNVEHEIVETITPSSFDFYDKKTNTVLTTFNTANNWGFVPLWKVYNEYSADIGGGTSDIEPVVPFINALHDVVEQSLQAHRYHSIPKAKFKVKDVDAFIANNWPDAIDPDTKKIRDGAEINWQGHEILFFSPDEDGGFIEAKSVLGDSKTLMDFLIDCICVASETPRWAYMIDDKAVRTSANVDAFKKKIDRKRTGFRELFVMVCKMALAANGRTPNTPRLVWQPVSLEDLASKGQSAQQLIMGLDVATANGWVATSTAIRILSALFPEIGAPEEEMALAEKNKNLASNGDAAAPAPASDTQALQLPVPSKNGNGGGSKSSAKSVVSQATTAPSRS